jgi:hypothetical protein
MLTQQQYNDLWTNSLAMPIQNIPCYYQYLQREVYFQDYIDLFCCPNNGQPTFPRKVLTNNNLQLHTVFVPGLTYNPTYTIIDQSNNQVRLIVDYDYPYSNELCKKRKIKYILIGEAAPPSGKYIYKDGKGSYITSALKWKKHDISKIKGFDRLLKFADEGFLLIDFFPFGIDFQNNINLRKRLIQNNDVLKTFITLLEIKIKNLQCLISNWDFCLVAPMTTSIGIIDWLNNNNNFNLAGKSTQHVNDLIDYPSFIDKKGKIHIEHTNDPSPANWTKTHVTKRAKFTIMIGSSGPHYILIERAF